jgi:flavodoxin
MSNKLKFRLSIMSFVILALLSVALFYYYKIQTSWVDSPVYSRKGTEPARTLVVVYSRTGNTFGAAKEISSFLNAELLQIKAPQYDTTINGQMLASKDADNEVTMTDIQHKAVDLSQYELIVLCSPTWWFRPAPPLWSFVENHNFSGKKVFLMMTGNSRYKNKFIDEFETLVKQKNGDFADFLFIRRGRIFWQKTPDDVSVEIREALEKRKFFMQYKD